MRRAKQIVFLIVVLLLAMAAFGQDDKDVPVLKRRPAPATDTTQPATSPSPSNSPDTQPPADTQPPSTAPNTQPQSAPPSPQSAPLPPEPSQPADDTSTTASVRSSADVAPRGAEVIGFEAAGTSHRVIVTRSGGAIRLMANNSDDADTAGRISLHLRRVASQLARGDFSTPGTGGQAPGIAVMRQMRNKIVYTAHAIDGGAELIISSTDPKAIDAIHQFLQSQDR